MIIKATDPIDRLLALAMLCVIIGAVVAGLVLIVAVSL